MKILVIGQAPPAKEQEYPYSTTMFYSWCKEIGIYKEKALELFDFDAVYDKFPGFSSLGGHKLPTQEQMEEYWERSLKKKVESAEKVLILGGVARKFLEGKIIDKKVAYLIHSSLRNTNYYRDNKDKILLVLKQIIWK